MSDRSLTKLKLPSPRYRLGPVTNLNLIGLNFETRRSSAIEDETRIYRLVSAPLHIAAQITAAKQLADRLVQGDERGGWPDTLVSARYMRDQRIRIVGAIWELVDNSTSRVATFTLIPRGWDLSSEELATADPIKMLAAVRSYLNRSGAKDADGWAIIFIHGEFDPGRQRFQLHLHGVAADGLIDVVDRLRRRPKYASERLGTVGAGDRVFHRVWISRKPLTNLPSPLTYILQPFWPSRWTGDTGGGGMNRQRTKHRIPEPYHTQYLLWLDQWSLSDIALLMKLRVRSGRLISK